MLWGNFLNICSVSNLSECSFFGGFVVVFCFVVLLSGWLLIEHIHYLLPTSYGVHVLDSK